MNVQAKVFVTVGLTCALALLGGVTYRILAAGGLNGTSTSTTNNLRQSIANTSGLVAWYPLDGDAKDYGGNHYDGAATNFTFNGITDGWTGGKFGKSIMLTGSGSYISAPGTNLPIGSSPRTLTAWIYPFSTNSTWNIVGYGQGNCPGLQSGIGTFSNKLVFWGGCDDVDSLTSSLLIPLNQWSLVTASYGGAKGLALSVNGVFATYAISSNLNTPLSRLFIGGATTNDGGNFISLFHGRIDDVRIYNRALSASEITALYAGTPSQNCDQTCKVWLKLDDNTGTSAVDSSGLGNTGTLSGTTTWTTGNFASAVVLDGSTGAIAVPNLALTSGTVDVWINPTTISGDQRIFSQSSGSSTQAGSIALNQSSGESGSLWVWDGSTWQRLSANGSVTAGTWNHIVVTNSGGTATAYLNGTQQLSAAAAFNFSGVPATIGGKFLGTTGGTFNGTVDDFRVYSRILAPEEVAEQQRQGS